jgi:hypothetical protein
MAWRLKFAVVKTIPPGPEALMPDMRQPFFWVLVESDLERNVIARSDREFGSEADARSDIRAFQRGDGERPNRKGLPRIRRLSCLGVRHLLGRIFPAELSLPHFFPLTRGNAGAYGRGGNWSSSRQARGPPTPDDS